MAPLSVIFTDIGELVSCAGASAKQGKFVAEADLGVILQAAMVVQNGVIEWVGAQKDLPSEFNQGEEISLRQQTVLPAFIEAHTHLLFSGSRQHEFELRNQGVSYQEIGKQGGGILSTVRETRKASVSELQALGLKRMWRFIRQGVTTIECKSGYGLDTSTEIKMLEIINSLKPARMIGTFLGAHALPPEFKSAQEYLNYLQEKVLPILDERKLCQRIDIFIDQGYFSPEDARPFLHEAQKLGLQVTIHAEQLSHSGGTGLAVELSALSADHLVEISDEDITKLAASQVTCVLLPGSDFYLKLQYPRARDLINKGARVALATDYNPGSCPTQDLSFIGVLARLEMKMTLAEVIAAYTINAAFALGLQDQLGSLEVGKSADFSVIADHWQGLFYQVGHHPVTAVYSKGNELWAITDLP